MICLAHKITDRSDKTAFQKRIPQPFQTRLEKFAAALSNAVTRILDYFKSSIHLRPYTIAPNPAPSPETGSNSSATQRAWIGRSASRSGLYEQLRFHLKNGQVSADSPWGGDSYQTVKQEEARLVATKLFKIGDKVRVNLPGGTALNGETEKKLSNARIALRTEFWTVGKLFDNGDVGIISNSGVKASVPAEYLGINRDRPYFSAKRDSKLDLNGSAVMSGTDVQEVKANERVHCRHLATYWEQQFAAGNGKVNYDNLGTPEAINRNVTKDMEAAHTDRMLYSKGAIVSNADWGHQISERFREMDEGGEEFGTILVHTTNHAMALGLKLKTGDDNNKSYVVQFYDPNHTVAHMRVAVEVSDLESLEALTAQDFLSSHELSTYDMDDGCAFFGRRLRQGERHVAPIASNPTSRVVHLMCSNADPDGLRELGTSLERMPLDERLELLKAKRDNGTPGLSVAMQMNHADAISAFCDVVQSSGLTTDQLFELLEAKRENGTPGLYMALQDGHADAIGVFCDAVRNSGLTTNQQCELLKAKRENGTPGLYIALKVGRADAVRVFGQKVRESGLSQEQKFEILAATYDTVPSIRITKDKKTLEAYTKIVLACELTPGQNKKLLEQSSKLY